MYTNAIVAICLQAKIKEYSNLDEAQQLKGDKYSQFSNSDATFSLSLTYKNTFLASDAK